MHNAKFAPTSVQCAPIHLIASIFRIQLLGLFVSVAVVFKFIHWAPSECVNLHSEPETGNFFEFFRKMRFPLNSFRRIVGFAGAVQGKIAFCPKKSKNLPLSGSESRYSIRPNRTDDPRRPFSSLSIFCFVCIHLRSAPPKSRRSRNTVFLLQV